MKIILVIILMSSLAFSQRQIFVRTEAGTYVRLGSAVVSGDSIIVYPPTSIDSLSLRALRVIGLGTFNGGVSARLLSTIDTVKTNRIVLQPDLTSGAIEMGRIRWDSTARSFYGTQYLVERSFQMNHNIHTDSLFISGTAAETNIDTVIMGANYPTSSKIVETKLFGKYNANGGGSKTFIFRIRLAGVMLDSVTITTPSGGSTSEPVEVFHQLGFRSVGASGTCYSILKTTSEVGVKMNAKTSYGVNTTSQNLFIISLQISDATAGNNFQRETTYTATIN